jgi:hypothetical protein
VKPVYDYEIPKSFQAFLESKIKKVLGGLMENPPEVAGPVS